MTDFDAVVVGAGPNGLAAAITLAEAGLAVLVVEGHEQIGGGCRTAELTEPGFRHDVCSAVHPFGAASPFLRKLPLGDFGLDWIHPDVPFAHPLDGGRAVVAERSVEGTASWLGPDAGAYQRLMQPIVKNGQAVLDQFLGPLRPPRHPFALARFGVQAIRSATGLAKTRFTGEEAPALLAGLAAHSVQPLSKVATAGIGLAFGLLAHTTGWPIPKGGSARITEALAGYLQSLGGKIECGRWVTTIDELPPARVVLFDVAPRQLTAIAGHRLPGRYRRALERFRYGPGVYKVDYALDGPIPWTAEACRGAGTVHLGGTMAEIAAAERMVADGHHPEHPFVLLSEPSVFDPTRAPAGKHVAWAYCHVPNGSTVSMTERITGQIERFAPGFRERILATSEVNTADLESYNPNYVGGDIAGGAMDLRQLFTRPVARIVPHTTPDPRIFLCSSSTPPGPGVHGMCGWWAGRAALRRLR